MDNSVVGYEDIQPMHVVISIIAILTCSIGIHAFNSNEEYKADHSTQFAILVFLLVVSVIITIVTVSSMISYNREALKEMGQKGYDVSKEFTRRNFIRGASASTDP